METPPPPSPAPADARVSPKSKSQYSIDTLWDVQVEKLKQHGTDPKESQAEFKQRMYQEYKQLSKVRKENQDVVMTYDAQEKKCKLDLKDK